MSPDEGFTSEPIEVLNRAFQLGEEGEWEEAARILRDAVAAEPEDADLVCWLGVAERELGMEGVAYERFRRALALDPTDPTVLTTIGSALAAFDDSAAEPALRSAALLAPESPMTRWNYGAYLSREGMLPEALRELQAAVELDETAETAHYELGVARALMGDLHTAIDDFETAARLAADDGWIRAVLGLALVQAGRADEAVSELHRAAGKRVTDTELQLVAAVASAAFGHSAAAWELLERARMSGTPTDMADALEVEDQLDEDDGLGELLAELAASAFRSRLMVRP